jgi:hypothetical protein
VSSFDSLHAESISLVKEVKTQSRKKFEPKTTSCSPISIGDSSSDDEAEFIDLENDSFEMTTRLKESGAKQKKM